MNKNLKNNEKIALNILKPMLANSYLGGGLSSLTVY